MSLEFVAEVKPSEITCNFEDLKAALSTQMQAYAGLEITDENIPERKADIATLRKIRGAIEDKRKDIKKTYDAPLKEFEAQVKGLTEILDKEISRIDGAIKEFDQKRVEEKQAHIKELYDQNIGDLAEFLPLAAIKNPKWDNKTCADNAIVSDIQAMVIKVRNDLTAIKALNSPFEEKVIAAYKASGNQLAVAIQRNTEYLEAKAAAEQVVREEVKAEAPETVTLSVHPVPKTENIPVRVIRVTGKDNVEALENFLELSGIDYEEVEG